MSATCKLMLTALMVTDPVLVSIMPLIPKYWSSVRLTPVALLSLPVKNLTSALPKVVPAAEFVVSMEAVIAAKPVSPMAPLVLVSETL